MMKTTSGPNNSRWNILGGGKSTTKDHGGRSISSETRPESLVSFDNDSITSSNQSQFLQEMSRSEPFPRSIDSSSSHSFVREERSAFLNDRKTTGGNRHASTRALLQSTSITRHARESIEQLTDLRFSGSQLFGRESEMRRLTAAFKRVRMTTPDETNRGPELVLISGPSGTGKSAMAKQLALDGGAAGKVFQGKFDLNSSAAHQDQRRSHEPYLALVEAYEEMCAYFYLTHDKSSEAASSIRHKLLQLLGEDSLQRGNVLIDMIPSLRKLLRLDTQATMPEERLPIEATDLSTSQHRLVYWFRSLTRIFSEFLHPLVLVIDDLQWADEPSLHLISKLVTDTRNPHLLLVGTYRDNEATYLLPWIAEMKSKIGDNLEEIPLEDLVVESVNDIVSHVLKSDSTQTKELANIVHRKTHGNPFFVVQFVTALRDMGILDYHMGSMRWHWEESKVEEQFVTDNVLAEILSTKLSNLDRSSQLVCQIAACLGANSNVCLLEIGAKALQLEAEMETTVQDSVDNLVNGGIFERGSAYTDFHFAHDQIQETAASMIPDDLNREWKMKIGEGMLLSTFAETDHWLFTIADLCNHGLSMALEDDEWRTKLIHLNHRAGMKAMASSAYPAAKTYFETAIFLLDDNVCWANDSRVALDLHRAAAEAEYCNGHFDNMQNHIDKIVNRADLPLDSKIRPYATMVVSLTARANYRGCLHTGLDVLNQLGLKFPTKASATKVLIEFVKTKMALKSRSVEELSNLPILTDEKHIYTERILDVLCTATYTSQPEYFPLLPLRHIRLCIKHGVGPYSPVAFATFGIFLCGKFGALQEGNKYGKVAMDILRRLPDQSCAARMAFINNAFVAHWISPAHQTISTLKEGYNLGMEIGDVESAMYCLLCVVNNSWSCGKKLTLIDDEARKAYKLMEEHNQTASRCFTAAFWQFVLNLMGKSVDPLVLVGEAMGQEEMLEFAKKFKNSHLISLIYSLQMQLAYLLGSVELMEELQYKAEDLPEHGTASIQHQRHIFYEGMVSCMLAGGLPGKKRRYMNRAIKVKKLIQGWLDEGHVNSTHCVPLLEAELKVLKGKRMKAKQYYEVAISIASKNGYQHDRALAHERAGLNFLALKDNYWASHHLTNAYNCYSSWGAVVKAKQLVDQHKDLVCISNRSFS